MTKCLGLVLCAAIALFLSPVSARCGESWTEPQTGMEFVWVSGACYQMGCGSWGTDCGNDETPVHEVCVDGFWMGTYEVTQSQWEQVMGANPSHFVNPDSPVEKITWDDVQTFINKLGALSGESFRLPTEAEWEFAARSGGLAQQYAGGGDLGAVAWYDGNSGRTTHPVGQLAPNGLGLYDMSGNVHEWVQDAYDRRAYESHAGSNPLVTSGSDRRVIRGGSWAHEASFQEASRRNRIQATSSNTQIGFRLVRSGN